jgi:hypothetical protein
MTDALSAYSVYCPEGREPELVESGVLYLDVLGVEIGACGEDPLDYLRQLRSALDAARFAGGIDKPTPLHVRALFSDSVIAAFPLQGGLEPANVIGPAEVMAARIQLELISHGFFLRGGIAFGNHYMDPNLAFGPALVEAWMLEKQAVVPRVVLSANAATAEREAMAQFENDGETPQRQYLLTDADELTFVSYLDILIDVDDEEEARKWLDRHRAVVTEKLREHAGKPAIEAKYLWAARYHNYVCQHRAPQPFGCEYAIALDDLPPGLVGFGSDVSFHAPFEGEDNDR